jgi:CheY-like chemotaxis protein
MGHSRHIPIIALTAHDPASYRDTCRQADMDDLLSKPCTLSECARVLRRWIPSWRAARARGAGTVQSPQRTELATTQPMPSASATGDLADVDASAVRRLRNLRGGASNDLYERLVELFQSGSVQAMAQLGAALERQDLKDAAAICHKLGSLEHSCVAGDATRARATQQRLQQAQPALLQELTSIRMKASA